MSRMILAPLRRARDYEAARERLAELEDDLDDDEVSQDMEDEAEALEMLVEDFEEREGVEDDDDDFELVPRLAEPAPEPVARFILPNGNSVEFLAAPFGGEVFVAETSAEGSEDMMLDGEIAPAALFARLSASNTAVPRALSRLDRVGLLEGRKSCDAVAGEIAVDPKIFGADVLPAAAAQAGSCQSDPAGAAFFQAHHCGTGGGAGYGPRESYCYPNASSWIQKTSGMRCRATYSRMAACGSSTCRLRHFYKKVSGYHTQLIIDVAPPRVVSYWSYKQGIRRKRRVRFERLGDNAIVRGWVVYHKFAAEISV